MNVAEECLICLKEKKWDTLNNILSEKSNCEELSSNPIFQVFESNLINEVEKYERDGSEGLAIVVARVFQVATSKENLLSLSKTSIFQIAKYLFDKYPLEEYAEHLSGYDRAEEFLNRKESERDENVKKSLIAANLDIKIGEDGGFDFSKSIFNSPQEQEFYLAAQAVLNKKIILPNIALSTIIDSKITRLLDSSTTDYFYKATLDLCIVDPQSFRPIFFIELDSSWHDKPKQIKKDLMKDEIFKLAGYKLHRIRKTRNKTIVEIFKIYIQKHFRV